MVFEDGSGTLEETQIELGASPMAHRVTTRNAAGTANSVALMLAAGPDGRVIATGLLPGERLELEAQDPSGAPLGWRETIVLGSGESRRLEVDLTGAFARLHGRVIDEGGAPLEAACILIVGSEALPLECNGSGHFESEPLHAPFVDLLAQAPGHAARLIAGQPTSQQAEIVLGSGTNLMVSVLDEEGRSWPADRVQARLGGRVVAQGELCADGRYSVNHFPSGAELEAIVGGCALRVAPVGSEAMVRISSPGSLRVLWGNIVDAQTCTAIRLESRKRGCVVWHSLTAEELAARSVVFPLVLPGTYVVELISEGEAGQIMILSRDPEVEVHGSSTVEVTFGR